MPIYADDVQVELLLETVSGSIMRLDLTMLEELVTTEQPGEIPMRLQAVVPNLDTDEGPLQELIALNSHLRMSCDFGEGPFTIQDFWVRARNFIDDGRERLEIIAYDPLWQLAKDECTYFMTNPINPATSIIRRVLEDRTVAIGQLPGPATPIHGLRFVSPTRLELIQQVLMWGWQHAPADSPDRDPWMPRWQDGTFNLVQPGKNSPIWAIHQDAGVSYFSDSTSMEDFVSEVYMIGPDTLTLPSAGSYNLFSPFTALVPNKNVNYAALANVDPAAPPAPVQLLAQELVDLTTLADFQQAQKYAHVRKVLTAEAGAALLVYQEALDLLYIKGIPWQVTNVECVLMPWIRRGDAVIVTAATYNNYKGIVTGVEHNFQTWRTHLTFDSSGIFGRRTRRQHDFGLLPGGDVGILPGDPNALPGSGQIFDDPLSAAPTLLPDISLWVPGSDIVSPQESLNRIGSNLIASQFTRTSTKWNPAQPAVRQTMEWTCSAAATAWMLQSVGFTIGEIQVKDWLGPGNINPQWGLLDGSGAAIVALLSKPPFNLGAHNQAMTYDQMLAMAGTRPMIIGGNHWTQGGHWSGVRGRSGDNLDLANPSPGAAGVDDTLTRARAGFLGPFNVVWLDV